MMKRSLLPAAAILFAAACATAPVPLTEERRVVGTENGVRIDALVRGDVLGTTNNIPFSYDVTNERATPIAVADIVPESSYDADTQSVIVSLGSEVPGESFLPRLVLIAPGEKKTFTGVVRIAIRPNDPRVRAPHTLQLKLNFLGDVAPFRELIGIEEKTVHDPALADRLFPLWLERTEVVLTNTLPMRWRPPVSDEGAAVR